LTRYEEAEVCYTEACRVLDSHDQSVSAEAIVIHNNWGCLHLLAGRSAKAVESHQCALEMRWLLEPGDNPALAESERNLAISAMEAGDGDTAHRLFHEALRRGDRLGQAWQTKGIELLLCLAKLHMMREELGDAEMILVEAFNRHESMGGAQDSLTPFLLNGLGCIYAEGRCFREARRMFQKALESRQKLVAGAQIDLAVCHANLAVIELELGAVRQSEAALRRAAGLLDGIHHGSPEASHVAWLQKSWEGPAELPSLGARLLGSPAVYRPWPPATLLIEGTAP
jgi:tetratricopeptide (TPR) repeat protein